MIDYANALKRGKQDSFSSRDDDGDEKLSNFIVFLFLSLFFLNVSVNLNSGLYANAGKISLMMKALVAVFFLRAFPILLARNMRTLLVVLVSVGLVVTTQLLFGRDKVGFLSYFMDFSLFCLPGFLIALGIRDFAILYFRIIKISRLLVYSAPILLAWIYGVNGGWFGGNSYKMGFGYAMLTPTLFFLDHCIRKPKLLDFFALGCAVFSIIIFGSRGAILCLLVYLVSYYFLFITSNANRFLLGIVMMGLLFVVLLFRQPLFEATKIALSAIGLRSRTLASLLSVGPMNLSGRDELWREALSAIRVSPIVGHGIGGEVSLMGKYPHNVVLELILDFGIVQGIAILVMILISAMRTMKMEARNTGFGLVLVLFSLAVPRLMVSGTIWNTDKFWILLALLLVFPRYVARMRDPAIIPRSIQANGEGT